MRGKLMMFGGITLFVAVSAGALAIWRQASKPMPVKPAPVVQAAPPVKVEPTELSITGQISAQKVVNVPATADGVIETFAVDAGENVFEGQLLARIKNVKVASAMEMAASDAQKAETRVKETEAAIVAARLEASRAHADASRAKSELDRAEKAYTRQKLLYAEGATPRLVYEKAEHDYAALKDEAESKSALAQQSEDHGAQLSRDLELYKRASDDRNKTMEQANGKSAGGEVRSPCDGLILTRKSKQGAEVSRAMDDLFTIATAMSAMEVILEPTPPQLARIHAGQAAAIHLIGVKSETIEGAVREVKGNQVIVDFISPTPLIKPGLTAQVTIKLT